MKNKTTNSKMYFRDLHNAAKGKGLLKATPEGLDALDRWLTKKSEGLKDEKTREYQAERIHLLDDQYSGKTYTARLLDYLAAYGMRLIWKSHAAENSEKEAQLQNLLTSIRNASQQSLSPFSIPLYTLLVDHLSKHRSHVPDIANPSQIVDEDSLINVAAPNSLVMLKNASRVYVIGDLHGDASTTKLIVNRLRDNISKTGRKPAKVVFLGDYVNNGLQSIGVLEEVLRFKREFAKSVTLLSGNHEFGETYATALTEFLSTHWKQWLDMSAFITPEWKAPPKHYGHIRLDLALHYGAEVGEAIHRKFELWGRSLALCALYRCVFMCHSIGPSKPKPDGFSRRALGEAKKDRSDIEKLVFGGYEAWKDSKPSLHASMVNNRDITDATLNMLEKGIKTKLFLVGHTHYRSGDRDVKGRPLLRLAKPQKPGCLATICSSHPRSIDAGHYIAREFEWRRKEKCGSTEPSRNCIATSCVAVLDNSITELRPEHLVPLYQL